ncbi:MAG: DUF86 domain-containing protein [Verrucomicrobiota bacterium JB022]|nr:DUF86 domain-containing protein [Verrucomicrobiota bacterium JB022]
MPSDALLLKAESIRRCVLRVERFLHLSPEQLQADVDAQDIVALNLQRAVQLAVDMVAMVLAEDDHPVMPTMADGFRLLAREQRLDPELAERMARSVGLRNLIVHDYAEINWEIVHRVMHAHLNDFRLFLHQIFQS